MRWQQGRRSTNIENRQRLGGKTVAGGGIGFLVLALIVGLMGGDPAPLLREGIERTVESHISKNSGLSEEQIKESSEFVSVVLGSTEDVWNTEFRSVGQSYSDPTLVLFTGRVSSACGYATAASGPFYCPTDQKIYIDLSFYNDLKNDLNAPGDFAQAYVIAHEVGHHVQNLMGVIPKINALKAKSSEKIANQLSVRVELQADCLSGIWARRVQDEYNMIEEGDIEEALNAASQIGDDRLQKQSQGYVVPDSFTHGSSAQRERWFRTGFNADDIDSCNTFDVERI
ncbi:MAG: neutral zinc metallopeptidase [Alphaproteobacteria bacterium]